jgi:hypothetical protein
MTDCAADSRQTSATSAASKTATAEEAMGSERRARSGMSSIAQTRAGIMEYSGGSVHHNPQNWRKKTELLA